MSRRSLALPSTRSTEPDEDELEAGAEEEPAAARFAETVRTRAS